MNRRWQDDDKEGESTVGFSLSSKKPVKPGPLAGGKTSSVQDKPSKRGVQDRDDNHPDKSGEIWEGTRKFGPFRPKK